MKILYTCLSKSWGGMEMITVDSIKALLERNVHVELICEAESRIHIEANNIGTIIYPIKAPGYFHPFATLKTSSIIKNGKYDLVHTHFSHDLWLLVPALKLIRSTVPLLLTKQVGSFIKKKDALHNFLYRRVDYALAISTVIKKNLMETTVLGEDKIILHPNGVDMNEFNPDDIDRTLIRKEFNILENEIVIGMIARFTPGKGHEEFLLAAKQLNEKYNNLKYLIVGEASYGEDKYEKHIKNLAEEYKLDNVIFTGFRADIPQVLSAMDIFVFPSHAEAQGIALIEAMAMKKPTVNTDADGVRDICIDNVNGLLFKKQDSKELAEKIELLINSPDLRIKLGEEGRKYVMQKFDFNKLTDRLVELYKKIIEEKKKK